MLRQFSLWTVLFLFLLVPAQALAGGPPWLCLPVEGVTPGNAAAGAELLTRKLGPWLSPHVRGERDVQLRRHADQWRLTFYMGKDVRLSDVETALRGSGYSVPRDKLRMFGHAILEIEAPTGTEDNLVAALEALDHVSIEESQLVGDRLLVTVDMPYPVFDGPERLSVRWDRFERNDFSSDQSSRSAPPVSAPELPGYAAFRQTVAKHGGALKEIRWSVEHACRPLGAVAGDNAAEARTPAASYRERLGS